MARQGVRLETGMAPGLTWGTPQKFLGGWGVSGGFGFFKMALGGSKTPQDELGGFFKNMGGGGFWGVF